MMICKATFICATLIETYAMCALFDMKPDELILKLIWAVHFVKSVKIAFYSLACFILQIFAGLAVFNVRLNQVKTNGNREEIRCFEFVTLTKDYYSMLIDISQFNNIAKYVICNFNFLFVPVLSAYIVACFSNSASSLIRVLLICVAIKKAFFCNDNVLSRQNRNDSFESSKVTLEPFYWSSSQGRKVQNNLYREIQAILSFMPVFKAPSLDYQFII